MAAYQYANNATTTLSASLTSGAASLTVVSGALFPAGGKFTVLIDSEIILVTGVAGTTWTIQRGAEATSAAAHDSGATVTAILTKLSLLGNPGPMTTAGDMVRGTTSGEPERIAVGSSGHVLQVVGGVPLFGVPPVPAFHGAYAYLSGDASIANATSELVALATELYDTDGFHAASPNSRMTIPAGMGGYYRIDAVASFAANSTGNRQIRVNKNGALDSAVTVFAATSADAANVVLSSTRELVAGDYLEIAVLQRSGGALNALGGSPHETYLAVALLGI